MKSEGEYAAADQTKQQATDPRQGSRVPHKNDDALAVCAKNLKTMTLPERSRSAVNYSHSVSTRHQVHWCGDDGEPLNEVYVHCANQGVIRTP
jgi:hypothetical protein